MLILYFVLPLLLLLLAWFLFKPRAPLYNILTGRYSVSLKRMPRPVNNETLNIEKDSVSGFWRILRKAGNIAALWMFFAGNYCMSSVFGKELPQSINKYDADAQAKADIPTIVLQTPARENLPADCPPRLDITKLALADKKLAVTDCVIPSAPTPWSNATPFVQAAPWSNATPFVQASPFVQAAPWSQWNQWAQWAQWNQWNQWTQWNQWNQWKQWANWNNWSNWSQAWTRWAPWAQSPHGQYQHSWYQGWSNHGTFIDPRESARARKYGAFLWQKK